MDQNPGRPDGNFFHRRQSESDTACLLFVNTVYPLN